MGLQEYKRKRDFHKTPEPLGTNAAANAERQFVVQKHAASRLHYDFRLELDGVLKSWAVPKGPSLDPGVKALAVQVEDHPLDYGDFEGVIPEGEYGGGTVMVWDRGTWQPEGDAEKGFKQGKLKFQLFGEKLRGSWALVRMSGRAGDDGKNWLLIKHRDKDARPDAKTDILARKPRSVVSGRTMDAIAADADRVWSNNGKPAPKKPNNGKGKFTDLAKYLNGLDGARQAKQPTKLQPQLCTLAATVPAGEQWLHELKFDGYRILAFIERGNVRLVTRQGNDWTARLKPVADALHKLSIENAILDGEVVALNQDGIADFQRLQNSLKRKDYDALVYYLFDVPHCEGFDLTETRLIERKAVLARLVPSNRANQNDRLRYSDHIRGQGEHIWQQACNGELEGIVSKLADSGYQSARSRNWLKIKCLKRQEFVIGGFTKPSGSRLGFGALLLGFYQGGYLVYCGRVGTGFTQQSLRQLKAELQQRVADKPPFANPPTGASRRGVTWVRPELVGEVAFTEWTDDGILRHPSFYGLREDKSPQHVGREKPRAVGTSPKRNNGTPGGKTMNKSTSASRRRSGTANNDAEVAGVRISHPDRVLYAEQKLTKLDLAKYYERVADWILPHVSGRPLTLVRCPTGPEGECFYQKHLTVSLPGTVRGVAIKEKGQASEYVVIDDLPGLISLVQMGVLEIHPWPARADAVEKPDRLVFDLDPGDGVGWKEIIQGASDVRDYLQGFGLESFLRTSGGKGLHVVAPLSRRNSWEQHKEFAKGVADALVRQFPGRYVATLSKAKRRGKVFIDYLRNQRGATAIASYSTRARSGAPVATPLAWDELSARIKADTYLVRNLPKRLDSLKADPWRTFFTTRQSITGKMLSTVRS
ncbi:MAG: DNA ligase D [Pirellulales bacterium]